MATTEAAANTLEEWRRACGGTGTGMVGRGVATGGRSALSRILRAISSAVAFADAARSASDRDGMADGSGVGLDAEEGGPHVLADSDAPDGSQVLANVD